MLMLITRAKAVVKRKDGWNRNKHFTIKSKAAFWLSVMQGALGVASSVRTLRHIGMDATFKQPLNQKRRVKKKKLLQDKNEQRQCLSLFSFFVLQSLLFPHDGHKCTAACLHYLRHGIHPPLPSFRPILSVCLFLQRDPPRSVTGSGPGRL